MIWVGLINQMETLVEQTLISPKQERICQQPNASKFLLQLYISSLLPTQLNHNMDSPSLHSYISQFLKISQLIN